MNLREALPSQYASTKPEKESNLTESSDLRDRFKN